MDTLLGRTKSICQLFFIPIILFIILPTEQKDNKLGKYLFRYVHHVLVNQCSCSGFCIMWFKLLIYARTLECLIVVHVRLFFLQIFGCMYGLIRHCMSISTWLTKFITYKKPKIITVFIIILSDLYVKYALLRHVCLKILWKNCACTFIWTVPQLSTQE